jgi:hypothetical protein
MAKAKPKGGTLWALFLAMFAALLCTFAQLGSLIRQIAPQLRAANLDSDQAPAAIGAAAGAVFASSLLIAGVIWGVLYFAVLRRRAPQRGPSYFVTLLAVVAVTEILVISAVENSDQFYVYQQKEQARTAAHEIAQAFSHSVNPSSAAPFDTRVQAKGEAGEVERLVKGLVVSVEADRVNYVNELRAAGFPDCLKPAALAADPSQRTTRRKLESVRRIVAKYRAADDARLTAFRASVVAARLNGALKNQILAAFDKSAAAQRPIRQRWWDLEDAIVVEYQQAVALLAHAQGRWRVEKGRLEFANLADLNAFRAHLDNVQRMAAEEKSIQARSAQTLQQLAQQLQQNADDAD